MAANKSFTHGRTLADPDFALRAPITLAEFQNKATTPNPTIKWFELADYHRYDPYLVNVTALDNPQVGDVEFVFINCNTAQPMGNNQRINKNNWPLVYAAMPSTIPTPAQFAKGETVAFLMLNPQKLSPAMKTEAANSNAGPLAEFGKWPGSSGLAEITELKKSVLQLARLLPPNKLPARFKELGGEG